MHLKCKIGKRGTAGQGGWQFSIWGNIFYWFQCHTFYSACIFDCATFFIVTFLVILIYITVLLLCVIAECFAHLSHGLGFCPSVTTPFSRIKTVQARIMKSLLLAASRTPVFRNEILSPWVKGFPSNEGIKEGTPLKRHYFADIGSSSVKKIADR